MNEEKSIVALASCDTNSTSAVFTVNLDLAAELPPVHRHPAQI